MQRLRTRFSRGEEVKFISHLDIMRLWQRSMHRAGLPLAYSEGFNPHPRLSLAAPLAVGVTSSAELMDTFLLRYVSPTFFQTVLAQQLPPGIQILQVYATALPLPSLQSQVVCAEYEVEIETQQGRADIDTALDSLLAREQIPWHHERDTGTRHYDLRALVDDLWLIDTASGYCTLGMRLRNDSRGSGRPEQVAAALGFSQHPRSINRSRLVLKTS